MSGSTSVRSLVGLGGGDALGVLGLGLVLACADDRVDLVVGDERALQPDRLVGAHRDEQPVAHADQLLGALLVEDDPAVGQRRRGERQPGRHVGLDQPGDHVDRRPLGGQHEVDACGARLLGDPHDRVLDIARRRHHQVGQLVDDRDHIRIGAVLALTAERRGDLARPHLGVEVVDVPHPRRLHVLVALLHLLDQPRQRRRGLLRLRDDRGDQVRNAFVGRQFHHLRVDQDHPDLLRGGARQQRHQHRVDEARLARAGGTGDQQVRHLREVPRDVFALNVFAQRDHQRMVVAAGRRIGQHVGEAHHLAVGVGHLDADGGLARNRREHPDALGGDRIRDVLLQLGDLLDLDAGSQLDLVSRDGRSPRAAGDRRVDLELLQHFGDRLGHAVIGCTAPLRRVALLEQIQRRQRVRALHDAV